MIVLLKENSSPWPRSESYPAMGAIDLNHLLRYFFHATSDRQLDAEYNMGDDDTEPESDLTMESDKEPATQPKLTAQVKEKAPTPVEKQGDSETEYDEADPAMSEWFTVNVNADVGDAAVKEPAESETDPESDYAEADGDEDGGDWFIVKGTRGNDDESTTDRMSVTVSVWASTWSKIYIILMEQPEDSETPTVSKAKIHNPSSCLLLSILYNFLRVKMSSAWEKKM